MIFIWHLQLKKNGLAPSEKEKDKPKLSRGIRPDHYVSGKALVGVSTVAVIPHFNEEDGKIKPPPAFEPEEQARKGIKIEGSPSSLLLAASKKLLCLTSERVELTSPIVTSDNQTTVFQTTENQTTLHEHNSVCQNGNLDNLDATIVKSDNQTTEIRTTDFRTTKNHSILEKGLIVESKIIQNSVDSIEQLPPKKRKSISYNGYIPLKCTVFSPELFLVLKPGEFKIFSYLSFLRWRYSEKPCYVRAALPYLENGTGIGRSAVHEHLKRLIELNLIRCEEVNKKDGNLYFVSDKFIWATSDNQTTEIQTTENHSTEVRKSDDRLPKSGLQTSENQTKDLSSLSSFKFSLSLSPHAGFNERWQSLPKKMREREMVVIESLLKKFPNDLNDIYDEIQSVESSGRDRYGKICGSVIGLIESSWPGIKALRQEEAEKSERKALEQKKKAEQVQQKEKQSKIQNWEQKIKDEVAQLAKDHYDNLSNEDLESYLTRLQQQQGRRLAKGSPMTMGFVVNLIRQDLKLDELEIRRIAEVSLGGENSATSSVQ